MKKALIILVLGLTFNACEHNACDYTCSMEHLDIKKDLNNIRPEKVSHSFINNDCDIMNEWLNRKSLGSFMKNHTSFETRVEQLVDKTYIKDKFIP